MNLSKFGKNKIKQNLYNKGIAASDIQDAISQIDPDEEYENAKYLAEKRLKRLKGEDKNKINQKFISIWLIKASVMILLKEY